MPQLTEDQQQTLLSKIDRWKNRLFDFSGRNRLLLYKPTKTTTLELIEPSDLNLFDRIVVKDQIIYLPDISQKLEADELDDESLAGNKENHDIVFSHNSILKVRCRAKHFNQILYNLRLRAKTAREEQGVNILYLAFGFVTWKEIQKGEYIKSPLVLVPIELIRDSIGQPYKLKMLEEDIVVNPTFQEALRQYYSIIIPGIPDDADSQTLDRYFRTISKLISKQPGWRVEREVCMDVFTYQKQMIVADLNEHENDLQKNPFVLSICIPNYKLPQPNKDPISIDCLDDKVSPDETFQILDADSSQQEAIQAAKSGFSFVLQGPPGTGKSQTISNIISEFLSEGKKVLFVSAKMAALEVVQERLRKAGLGEFCLQIHSHKRNKREVIEELRQSLDTLSTSVPTIIQTKIHSLQGLRNQLNDYVRALHKPYFLQQLSAFMLYGFLDGLKNAPDMNFFISAPDVSLHNFEAQKHIIQQMTIYRDIVQNYSKHPWYGCIVNDSSPRKREEIVLFLKRLSEDIDLLLDVNLKLAKLYKLGTGPKSLISIKTFTKFADTFKPSVMQLSTGELIDRFENKYTGINRYFLLQYWRDRREILQVLRKNEWLEAHELLTGLSYAKQLQSHVKMEEKNVNSLDTGLEWLQKSIVVQRQINLTINQFSDMFQQNEKPLCLQNFEEQTLTNIGNLCNELINNIGDLNNWVAFQNYYHEGRDLGIASFIEEALSKSLDNRLWGDAFVKRYYSIYLDEILNKESVLNQFNSEVHEKTVNRFRELDHELISTAHLRVRKKILANRPQSNWIVAQSAEEAILRREIMKRRRIKPLRNLFSEIPGLILRLCPCLLMSPLTVSQLLDPRKFQFDLVIFDEASQIRPEEAVGAIIRGEQIIVVGDQHQLPPTSFFESIDIDEDTNSTNLEEDLESILNECDGSGMPNKMLAWHYRSRDESLIAFSNHYFYSDRLLTFPSAKISNDDIGVSYIFVEDGVYQRNGRRNIIEAKKVVELIIEHYKTKPDFSLGVVTFSQTQRDTIQIELDQTLRNFPALQQFFSESNDEPFFVKNLELVQGDERDVMIFSVGYAKDDLGKFLLNFGPLNKEGGERRLNVAVTRARYSVKMVSSFQPEDIDLSRTNSKGVHLLRSYMTLARDGLKSIYIDLNVTDNADFDSPFEQQVYEALSGNGLSLKKQVGVSGYRIDLAVMDPEHPGGYILGIECDGAAYHSSFTARDRDRLRQEILESLGWRIYRIWSRNWFENPSLEVKKVLKALEDAKRTPKNHNIVTNNNTLIARPQKTEISSNPPLPTRKTSSELPPGVKCYEPAKVISRLSNAQEFNSARSSEIAGLIKNIVEEEGPIHIDLLTTRIAQICKINRIGSRVESNIKFGIDYGLTNSYFIDRNCFFWLLPLKLPQIRVPGKNNDKRSINFISSEEIALAVNLCLQSALSLTGEDLVRETARLYQLTLSENVNTTISQIIGLMNKLKYIEVKGNKYYPIVKFKSNSLPILNTNKWSTIMQVINRTS